MDARDPWNEWVEPFDLFISYARKDNETGMVSALVEAIQANFARFSPSVPLKVFFDKQSILDMQYWQDRPKKGLHLRATDRANGVVAGEQFQDLGRLQSGLDMAQPGEPHPATGGRGRSPLRPEATRPGHIAHQALRGREHARQPCGGPFRTGGVRRRWGKLAAEGRLPSPNDCSSLKRRRQRAGGMDGLITPQAAVDFSPGVTTRSSPRRGGIVQPGATPGNRDRTQTRSRPERARERTGVASMSQSLVKNLLHLVFSTKHRAPLLTADIRPEMNAYLAGILRTWESPVHPRQLGRGSRPYSCSRCPRTMPSRRSSKRSRKGRPSGSRPRDLCSPISTGRRVTGRSPSANRTWRR